MSHSFKPCVCVVMEQVKKALFVCLGNTCRSPIAEAVFVNIVKERGAESKWETDSAAIKDWHVGSPPNQRAISVLKQHDILYYGTARQICPDDFREYDYIFGMDEYNTAYLEDKIKYVEEAKARIFLLGDFDPQGDRIIRDPYCDNNSTGFERCFQQAMRSCSAFLDMHE